MTTKEQLAEYVKTERKRRGSLIEGEKMLDFGFYNMDCMEGMKQFPDKYFDLAIVDPIYGDITQGEYAKSEKTAGRIIGSGLAKQKAYRKEVFRQPKTNKAYFDELFRISNNQIVWGGELLHGQYTARQSMLGCVG